MDVVGSVEFGDWINNELSMQKILSTSDDSILRRGVTVRIESLGIAKKLLLEFLTVQDERMRLANLQRSMPPAASD
jgi:hypothetical protein